MAAAVAPPGELAVRWEPIGVDIEAEPLDLPAGTTIDLRVPEALVATVVAGSGE